MSGEREVISLHVGQAGVQVGNHKWELFCQEHRIQPDGTMIDDQSVAVEEDQYNTFFSETSLGQHVPRAIFVDTEETVIDQVRTGTYRKLYNPCQLLTGKEDAANNFARGFHMLGREMVQATIDQVRSLAESCTCVQGFFIYHSIGGGTGSGFCANLAQKINDLFGKKTKLEVLIFPSPCSAAAVVEPFNAILYSHTSLDATDVSFMVDNSALYNAIDRGLQIENPSFTDCNRLVSQMISSFTASLRFSGTLNTDLAEFQINLVPFPRIHFPLASYAPIIARARMKHENLTVRKLISACFEPQNLLLQSDLKSGRYMACCMLFRGDVNPTEVNNGIQAIKQRSDITFVDWCPTGFKTGINNEPPQVTLNSPMAAAPRACCMLANHTSIGAVWQDVLGKMQLMHEKRAFVHWFVGEGMEEGELSEAHVDIQALRADYDEVGKDVK